MNLQVKRFWMSIEFFRLNDDDMWNMTYQTTFNDIYECHNDEVEFLYFEDNFYWFRIQWSNVFLFVLRREYLCQSLFKSLQLKTIHSFAFEHFTSKLNQSKRLYKILTHQTLILCLFSNLIFNIKATQILKFWNFVKTYFFSTIS